MVLNIYKVTAVLKCMERLTLECICVSPYVAPAEIQKHRRVTAEKLVY